MSNDWTVRCVDCQEDADINDANHMMELMQELVARADTLAALADFGHCGIELKIDFQYIDVEFFKKHKGHKLRPWCEYQEYDTPCAAVFTCARGCGQVMCKRREHPMDQWHYHTTEADSFVHRSVEEVEWMKAQTQD